LPPAAALVRSFRVLPWRTLAAGGLGAGLFLLATLAPARARAQSQGPAAGAEAADLAHAIDLFKKGQDDQAAPEFRALAARGPHCAAEAHLYLGLIAFNALRPDEAKAEFKRAIAADEAIEPPFLLTSPKARLAFDDARREYARDQQRSVPEGAVSSSPTVAATAEASHRSHWLAYLLGATGLVAAGVATYGGIQVLAYQNAAGSVRANPTTTPITYPQLQGELNTAQSWNVAWIVVAVGAAAALGAAPFAW
jgi:tetratricopeptide (TPR) repeat protein